MIKYYWWRDMLEIKDLTIKAQDKEILSDFNIDIDDGEIRVLMGPNGTGKSTICKVLMHHPDYEIIKGTIKYNEKNLNDLSPTAIGRLGFFLLGQNPTEIEGITNAELLRSIIGEKTGKKVDVFAFQKKLTECCTLVGLPKEFMHRDINFNMSGGEKKRNELLHLFMLEPKFIILDEVDSGLDVDALKVVGELLRKYYDMHKPTILIVTHHADILKYFNDYKVSIIEKGKIIKTGNKELASFIEKNGFRTNAIVGKENHE